MQNPNLPWLSSESSGSQHEKASDMQVPNQNAPNHTVTRVERRRSIHGSVRSRSFDGRLDLETLPEEREEDVEAAEKADGVRERERKRSKRDRET